MAKFIECNKLTSPTNDIYHIVSIYGLQGVGYDVSDWIEDNLDGKWTTYSFGYQCSLGNGGQAYCFSDESDAIAFKLRWM